MPMFVNILLIDVFFRIALGATFAALLIPGCLSAVIALTSHGSIERPFWMPLRTLLRLEWPHSLSKPSFGVARGS